MQVFFFDKPVLRACISHFCCHVGLLYHSTKASLYRR